ncbi:MAG TPA: serine/threonine-protein kinase [Polyangia bacterium]|nr:serine/threonine-protein kinase [Polyangia bacterium]
MGDAFLPPDAASPVRFGPYLLIRASGALGRLEMAVRTDVRDPEVCVLKRLPIQARAADAAARFRRQAQLAARLEHENIARTLRVETIEGQICVARELVQGMSLSKVMRQLGARPAPLVAALNIVRELARGLGYAHDCHGLDIVHGEVAPENVMIGFGGEVKLIDFGLGRPAGDASLAQGGVVMGHRAFLPPEAADGRDPGPAGDIYGLGVVLWELLTGQRADDAASPLADVRASNPDVPEELARVVARATAPLPEARYRSGDELGAALSTFLPAGADPQQETIALLRSCFEVDLLQPLLAKDIESARRLITGDPDADDRPRSGQPTTPLRGSLARPTPARPALDSTDPLPALRRRGPLAAAAVALLVAGAGIALLGRSPAERPAVSPPVAAAPQPAAPPPAAEPPPAPEPAPAPEPDPGAEPASSPRASRRGPGDFSRNARSEGADQLLRQANNLFEHGNTAGAMARTRQAIAAGAGAPARVLMATLFISLRNYTAAEPELNAATQLDPGNAEARRLLALLHRTAVEQDSR